MELQDVESYIKHNPSKPVAFNIDDVRYVFTAYYYMNPDLFGASFIPFNRDMPLPASLVMEDGAKKWGELNGRYVSIDYERKHIIFHPK